MLVVFWKVLLILLDWRTLIRKIMGQPTVDVMFITNMRDKVDRRRSLGIFKIFNPEHFSGHRYWWHDKSDYELYGMNSWLGISGRIRLINSMTSDLFKVHSRKKAQRQFKSAIEWGRKRGVKVILFAAGTKRLFTDLEMSEIKEKYSDILFTIGDNGTGIILQNEIKKTFMDFKFNKSKSNVAVIGPSGFLGGLAIEALKDKGVVNIFGVGSNSVRNARVKKKYNINVCSSLSDLSSIAEQGVDMVVACTHAEESRLNSVSIDTVRREGYGLIVVDPSEPANFTEEEYEKCVHDEALRFDAGNANVPGLITVGGSLSSRILRLDDSVMFGCFAETMVIARCVKSNYKSSVVRKIDWMSVDSIKMNTISDIFDHFGIEIPRRRCFGRLVGDSKVNRFREKVYFVDEDYEADEFIGRLGKIGFSFSQDVINKEGSKLHEVVKN